MENNRNLFYLANSFKETSGGRTQVTFTRAKMLADISDKSFILTFNFKRNYGEIYRVVRKNRNIPSSITFLNMYEFFAGEEIYSSKAVEKKMFTKDSRYTYKYIADKNAFKVYRNSIQFYYIKLDNEGTCEYKVFYDEKKRKIKRENYDVYGNIRVITFFDMISGNPIRKSYYADNQRMYLCIDYDRDTFNIKKCTTFDKNGNIYKEFITEEDMSKYWIASLNMEYPNSIFFVEDRKLDGVIIENQYSKKKIKSVAVIHSSHLKKPYKFGAKTNDYNGTLLRNTSGYSAVVLLTKQQLKHVRNQFGLQKNLYHIPHVKLEQRKKLLQRKDIYKIVIVSRFVEIKRIIDILEAFKLASEKIPKLKLEIWGSGEEEEEYKKFIKRNHLEKIVSIKGYTNSPNEVFYSAGLSIITSKYEGFGMTILECMANQTPMVAYDFNYGPKELIDDGVNGYIVENGNVDELANQIVAAYNDKKNLKNMGLAAKEKASAFSEDLIKKKWIKLIDDIEDYPQKSRNERMRQVVLLSEVTEIDKIEKENTIELNFTLQNVLSTGLPNERYYLYVSNYYDLDKIGDRYFELNAKNTKENFEVLTGSLTIDRTVYKELTEVAPKFLLGVGNKNNFDFVEVICNQIL